MVVLVVNGRSILPSATEGLRRCAEYVHNVSVSIRNRGHCSLLLLLAASCCLYLRGLFVFRVSPREKRL